MLASCTPNDFACYQQAFGNLAYRSGPKIALDQVSQLLSKNVPAVRADCHTITHYIGSAALVRYHGDAAAAIGEGTMLCGSGYYHGLIEYALEGATSPQQLTAKVVGLCTDRAALNTDFLRYQCLHGLGHGLMNLTGDNLPWALSMCSKLADDWSQRSCSGGVFMQNFNLPSKLSPFRSTFVRKNDLLYPCDSKKVIIEFKYYCYLQITEHILYATNHNWQQTAATCATAPKSWKGLCFQSFGRDAGGFSHYRPAVAYNYCRMTGSGLPDCIYGAARDFVNNDGNGNRGARFCALVQANLRGYCFYGVGTILRTLGRDSSWLTQTCQSLATSDATECEGFLSASDNAAIQQATRRPSPTWRPPSSTLPPSPASSLRPRCASKPAGRKALRGPPDDPFMLTYPGSWCVATFAQRTANLMHPLAALGPANDQAGIIIRPDTPATDTSSGNPARRLSALKKRFRDFSYVSAQALTGKAGHLVIYTFRGKEARIMHIVSVIPADNHSYLIDAIYRPGARQVAGQITATIRSFTPNPIAP